MKLYYSKGACSLAVRICIHELGVSCEYEAVDLKTKKTETGSDFLNIHPKGYVPILVLDNQEVLSENGAIQQYLADTFNGKDIFPLPDNFDRYRVLEWLSYVSTELHKGCSPLFNPKLPDNIKEEIFKPRLKASLDFVDRHLSKNKFLLAERFTLPDGYLFVILRWLPAFKIDIANWPNLKRYFEALKFRPSIQQSLKEEGLS